MVSAALLLCMDKDLSSSFFSRIFCKQKLNFSIYVLILAGLSFALLYSIILACFLKRFVSNSFPARLFLFSFWPRSESILKYLFFQLFLIFYIKAKKDVVSIEGIKLKSI